MKKTWAKEHWYLSLLLLHVVKWGYFFHRIDFHSPYPIFELDYAIYYFRALLTDHFLNTSGRFWGYDTFSMAGTLFGPIHEINSCLISQITHLLAPAIPIHSSLLMLEMGTLFFSPFALVAFVRNFGGTKDQSWMAFGLVTTLFGITEYLSRANLFNGLHTFIVGSFVSLWAVSLFWKWLTKRSWSAWLLFSVTFVLLPQLHPNNVLFILFPLAFIYLKRFRSLTFQEHGLLTVTAVLFVGVNLEFAKTVLHFWDWKGDTPYLGPFNLLLLWRLYGPVQVDVVTSLNTFFQDVLVIACGWLFWKNRRNKSGPWQMLGCWILFSMAITYAGGLIPVIRNLQPMRFVITFWPLVYCMVCLGGFFKPRHLIFPFLIMALSLSYGGVPRRICFTNVLPKAQQDFLDYAKANVPFPGRLLIEHGDRIGTCFFTDLIPFQTRQPIMGGNPSSNFLKTNFTIFTGDYWDGRDNVKDEPKIFKRRLSSMTEKEFLEYMDLYNISNIAVWSHESIKFLNGFKKLTLIERAGEFNWYKVEQTSGWFVEGAGELLQDYDRIIIKNPTRGRIVLKFHWLDTFKATPDVPLKPVFIKDDPVPFIEVWNYSDNQEITISNEGL